MKTPSTGASVTTFPDEIISTRTEAAYTESHRQCLPSPRFSHRVASVESRITNRSLTLGNLRIIWWSQWRQGYRLPAERGVIVIEGGRDG